MRKKLTLVSVMFACLFSANIFAQVTITVNGKAKISGSVDNKDIAVVVKSYLIGGYDFFGVSKTITTDASGAYSFSFTTPDLCLGGFCPTNAIVPLYITYTKGGLTETINENIPLTSPFTNITYTISKTPVLGGYLPQIGLITVDNDSTKKTMIVWERKDDATIASYNILKATTINGPYTQIGNVPQDVKYTVFRDMNSIPGKVKAFYKIEAVYSNGKKSEQSYPKTPLSLSVAISKDDSIPTLSFLNKDDIPLFDHSLYKTISIKRAVGNSKDFVVFKTFNLISNENASLIEMLGSLTDVVQSASKYTYVAVGDLVNSVKTHLKSDSGPFSQSLSNLAESQLTVSNVVTELVLSISPNPSKGIVNVTIPEDGTITVYDVLGQIISSLQVSQGVSQIDIKTTGIYTIVLKATKAYKAKLAIE